MSSVPDAIIDSEALANLRALGDEGDDTFLHEIITIYLEDTPLRLADIRAARASGDQPLYTRSAHTIKGSSANVGAAQVRAVAEKLEHASKVQPLDSLDAALADLEAAFGRAREELKKLLG